MTLDVIFMPKIHLLLGTPHFSAEDPGIPNATFASNRHLPVIDLDAERGGTSDQERNSMSPDTGESSAQHVNDSSKSFEYSVKVIPPGQEGRLPSPQTTSIHREKIRGC